MKKEKAKILFVEDDNFLIKAYQIKFERAGFDVFIATDGDKGLKIAEEKKPDLIVLDLIMPSMNGFEFLKNIKMNNGLKEIPVVILSNLGQISDKEKAISLGASDYIIKTDYTLEDIVKKISKYIK